MSKNIVSLMARLSLIFAFVISPLTAGVASAAPSASQPAPAAVDAYANVLRTINPHLASRQSHYLASHLLTNAGRWRVDANLLVALVTVESAWRTQARSRVGALGLGQLMPGTAANLGVNPRNPYQNLAGAARYLSGLLSLYAGKKTRYQLAFAAYNAGPKAVARFGGIPPYAETQNYVVRVMRTWKHINHVVRIPETVLAQREKSAPSIDPMSPGAADESYWSGSTR